MPLTDIGSYVTTMDEFIAHWTDTNAILGGTPATDLVLEGNVTLAMFITSRNDLEAKLIADQALENARQIATASRDGLKVAIRDRLMQFRGLIRGKFSKTKYAAAVPVLPDLGLSESKFLGAFDDAADLWGRIDADATIPGFTPPLKILLYGRTEFVADLAGVRVTFVTVTTAENDLEINQKERDMMLPIARERMVQYRVLVPALLGPTHPQSQSLPDLYPAPGSTPDPVVLTGGWNPATGQADFSWTESSNPALLEYEVKRCLGTTWNDATAIVIGNITADTPDPAAAVAIGTSFSTNSGLDSPGDAITVKVFVRLSTGNVAGSNAVTITRP